MKLEFVVEKDCDEIMREVYDVEDIGEVEKILDEVKDKIMKLSDKVAFEPGKEGQTVLVKMFKDGKVVGVYRSQIASKRCADILTEYEEAREAFWKDFAWISRIYFAKRFEEVVKDEVGGSD